MVMVVMVMSLVDAPLRGRDGAAVLVQLPRCRVEDPGESGAEDFMVAFVVLLKRSDEFGDWRQGGGRRLRSDVEPLH